MKKLLYLLVTGVLMAACVCLAGTPPREVLVFTTPTNEGVFTQYQREVLKEIHIRTGIECMLKELPKKRSLVDANKGEYAGVAARIRGLETDYPNLKMVGVSHFTVQHILFAKKRDIIETVNDIGTLTEDAARTGYIVGFLRGSKKAQTLLSELPAKKKVALDSPEKAFKILEMGRIGAYLAGPGIVNRAILKKRFSRSGIQEICVLTETQLFPYVHAKYAYLIPVLENALQSMVDDGTLDSIRNTLE